jgi:hypothetical protein
MVDLLLYVFLFALAALAVVAALWLVRIYLGGELPMAGLFGQRPEKRLAVVEHATLDGRRRLVLVRRDDVEHLIMTGGPVDVVIETGIGATLATPARYEAPAAASPAFGRQTRTFGRSASPKQQPQPQQVAE